MEWDDVSELKPQTGVLFIHQVMSAYGEPRWNDIDRGELIRPPEFSVNSTNSHVVVDQEEHGEGNAEFFLQTISFMHVGMFNMP
jgi:hypothetical protein